MIVNKKFLRMLKVSYFNYSEPLTAAENILEKQIRKLQSLQDETEIDKIIKKINKTKTELTKALNQLKKFKTEAIYEWDQYFMSIACLVALASNDVDSPVSKILIRCIDIIYSTGWCLHSYP